MMSTDSDGSVRRNATASDCASSKLLGDDTDPYLSPRVRGFHRGDEGEHCARTRNVRGGRAQRPSASQSWANWREKAETRPGSLVTIRFSSLKALALRVQ